MKTKSIIVIAVLVLALGCLSGCGFRTNYIYKNGDKYTAGNREIKDKIETINIDYMSGDVTLTVSDSDSINIKETSNKNLDDKRKVHTWVDGTTLYVKYCASAKKLDLNKLDKNLEITVPKNIKLEDIKVNLSSGDLNMNGFEAGAVDIETSSGNVDAAFAAKNIKMEASSGNITLTQTGDSDDVNVKVSSGKIKINMENAAKLRTEASSGGITLVAGKVKEFESETSSGDNSFTFAEAPEKSNIEASSGDVVITLPENSDLTAELNVSSGDISYDLPFSKNGGSYVCGSGSNHMKIETSSGDITFKTK